MTSVGEAMPGGEEERSDDLGGRTVEATIETSSWFPLEELTRPSVFRGVQSSQIWFLF